MSPREGRQLRVATLVLPPRNPRPSAHPLAPKGHSPGAGPPLGVLCRGSLSAPGPSRLSQPGSPGKAAAASSSSSSSLSDEWVEA